MSGRDGQALVIVDELCDDANENARRQRNLAEHPCELMERQGKITLQQLTAARQYLADWVVVCGDAASEMREFVDRSTWGDLAGGRAGSITRRRDLARLLGPYRHCVVEGIVVHQRWPVTSAAKMSVSPDLVVSVLGEGLDIVSDYYTARDGIGEEVGG